MAKSKLVKANEKIAEKVVGGYRKIEDGVVGGYKKLKKERSVVSQRCPTPLWISSSQRTGSQWKMRKRDLRLRRR